MCNERVQRRFPDDDLGYPALEKGYEGDLNYEDMISEYPQSLEEAEEQAAQKWNGFPKCLSGGHCRGHNGEAICAGVWDEECEENF